MSKKTDVMSALVRAGYDLDTYTEFERHMDSGSQRVGQAFVNALDRSMREQLTGSPHDPFYSDEVADVLDAIAYLGGAQ